MDLNLTNVLEEFLEQKSPDAPRYYIGASAIGKDCTRAIWYQSKGYAESNLPSRTKRILDNGKAIEYMLLDYLECAKTNIMRPTVENKFLHCADKEIPYFQGHMDALVIVPAGSIVILDIKTCKDVYFKQFKSQGLKQWSLAYYAQLQAYMGMTGYKYACLLAYNKNDSQIHDETITFDADYYAFLKDKARTIYLYEEPPERINRSPLFYKCSNCSYKTTCHASGA